MAICDFKLHIAECLSIQLNSKNGGKKQGRTSVDLEVKKKKDGVLPPLPAKAIMMNTNDHWLTMYLTIGDADFQDVKDVVMSSALNAALQI